MEPTKEIKHMKRWEFYSIIAVLVVVMGVAGWATYTYVWGPQDVETTDITPAQSAEDKSLTEIKTELEKDADLELADIESEMKDLESIDLSGV